MRFLTIIVNFLSAYYIFVVLVCAVIKASPFYQHNYFEKSTFRNAYSTVVSIQNLIVIDKKEREDGQIITNFNSTTGGVGILLDENGWVLTAKHVIMHGVKSATAEIMTPTDFVEDHEKAFALHPLNKDIKFARTMEYEKIVCLKDHDLALVKINFPDKVYKHTDFCKIDPIEKAQLGKESFIIRCKPNTHLEKFERFLLYGRISAFTNYQVRINEQEKFHVDIDAYPGDSGSPLINTETGNILGVAVHISVLKHSQSLNMEEESFYKASELAVLSPVVIKKLLIKAGLDPDDYFE